MTTKQPNIHGGAAAGGAATLGRGVSAATEEEQARAILRTARRAVEEEKKNGGPGTTKLSLKRSLEWFLEGRRKDKALRHGDDASSSSSSN